MGQKRLKLALIGVFGGKKNPKKTCFLFFGVKKDHKQEQDQPDDDTGA